MIKARPLVLILLLWILPLCTSAQKVGVVLSGGGASGMAHIGMLKALEEHEIPIDYIAGTSMGAVVGGLYAAGVTLEEMEAYFRSDDFQSVITGAIDEEFAYYFKKDENSAGMVKLRIDPDTLLLNTIPSYVVSPVQLDMRMLETLSSSIAVAAYDFDELMIPFRCAASDIVNKELVIFRDGELHEALRASSSFPFYFKPLVIDGKMLFDGGLYNNFPLDIMYNEFSPDVIIGCSVSLDTPPPTVDDLFSQIENMIVNRGSEELPCEEGIIIRPQTGVTTLDFTNSGLAIDAGYAETSLKMDSIKSLVSERFSAVEREIERRLFRAQRPEYKIGEVSLIGVNEPAQRYFRKVLRLDKASRPETLEEFKPLYFRILGDDKVKSVYPRMRYNRESERYDLSLDIEKGRKLILDFGGNFSSRPVNTGYVGLKYNILGSTPKTITANSYFGKFYNSVKLEMRLDIPGKIPYYLSLKGGLQQWDYFESFATFFQETKPSFILENERYGSVNIGRPIRNESKLTLNATYSYEDDEYYLTDAFGPSDTADVTLFEAGSVGAKYQRNTLNRKLYANEGTYFELGARYVNGRERTVPGSTGIFNDVTNSDHEWFSAGLKYENYFHSIGKLDIGMLFEARYSTQGFFANYRASVLNAPFFQPIPESKTLYQDEFRAHQFAAGGLKFVYPLSGSIDLRMEHYLFQPKNEIIPETDFQSEYSPDLVRRFYIGSSSAVFHSPLGPLSFSVNYYDQRSEHWSWIINFGYLIFNERALD